MDAIQTAQQVVKAIKAKTTKRVIVFVRLSDDKGAGLLISKAAALRVFIFVDPDQEVTTATWLDDNHTSLAIGS